ncbi:PaaX domain-containing protein, C- domain protein [Nocardia caishijiensis]|uniref:PaaX domain-containing protein, C- domain protein n=1 Tax=Nocardia caishijiensis TaxID=184756 RepID=UPI0019178FF0|nr:PaaX domain-containing protein, C- domain protein [Nocardia caishijiensis]
MKSDVTGADVRIRPVSARSALIRILIAADSPTMTAHQICAATTAAGYPEATVRVAVSRMVAAGDLVRANRVYTLAPHLRARRDDLLAPPTVPWQGDWEQVVITATGRSAADRAALRARLLSLRLGELREGVWMRPANLARDLRDLDDTTLALRLRAVDDPAALCARLWPLTDIADRARTLLAVIGTTDGDARFTAVCAGLDLLTTDPALPADLLPTHWAVDALRDATTSYLRWFQELSRASED